VNRAPPAEAAASRARAGLFYGLAAYGLWGIMPIYFKWLKAVPSIDIVAHRIVWSLVALAILATVAGAWDQVRAAIRHRRTLAFLFVTALLIGTNWLLYVYAINSGHILAGSLGYYLNPLANILLGRFILKEHLTKQQWAAVAIAAVSAVTVRRARRSMPACARISGLTARMYAIAVNVVSPACSSRPTDVWC